MTFDDITGDGRLWAVRYDSMRTIDILNKHKSNIPSKWKEDAEYRRKNANWLIYSAMIALQVKQRMSETGITQVMLAEKLGCTQQHISMLLKGKNNLTLETIAKLEDALEFSILKNVLIPGGSYANISTERPILLNEPDEIPYGNK